MSKQHAVFVASLGYVKGAYKILGIVDPPALPLLIHGLGASHQNPSVSELAGLTGLSLKSVSRTLRQIRDMGLIELEIDDQDERIRRVICTPKGKEALRSLYTNLASFGRALVAIDK